MGRPAGLAGAWGIGRPGRPPAAPSPVDTTLPATRMIEVAQTAGCRDPQYSGLSRFWELETGSDCGTFSFRGYRPITASVVTASSVNRQPTSSAPDHRRRSPSPTGAPKGTAATLRAHQDRPGPAHPEPSHTQGFAVVWLHPAVVLAGVLAPDLAPFRTTDHEPEVMYVCPPTHSCPGAGAGATAALAWCTSPTARACPCRAAGTAPT